MMEATKPSETFVETTSPTEVVENHEDISTSPSELDPKPRVSASTILAVFVSKGSWYPRFEA